MSKELQHLIEIARKHAMTAEERKAQVRSFAFGNTHIENSGITKSHIDEAMSSLQAERGERKATVRT